MSFKWNIDKCFGDNVFGLWKVNMYAILIQENFVKVLKGETLMFARLIETKKVKMVDKVICVVILYLEDKVIRKMLRVKIVASI